MYINAMKLYAHMHLLSTHYILRANVNLISITADELKSYYIYIAKWPTRTHYLLEITMYISPSPQHKSKRINPYMPLQSERGAAAV